MSGVFEGSIAGLRIPPIERRRDGHVRLARLPADRSVAQSIIDRLESALRDGVGATPTHDEYFLSIANAAKLRSPSHKQPTGAALVQDSSLIAVGANEELDGFGRLVWIADPDLREHSSIAEKGLRKPRILRRALATAGLDPALGDSAAFDELIALMDVDRKLHAESAALFDAARRGQATNGSLLFVTHRPCYRCARSAIAAGVSEVIFDFDVDGSLSDELVLELSYPLAIRQFVGIRWAQLPEFSLG